MSKLHRETGGFLSIGIKLRWKDKIKLLFNDHLYIGVEFCEGTKPFIRKSTDIEGGFLRVKITKDDEK